MKREGFEHHNDVLEGLTMMMLAHHGGCDDHHLPLLLLFEAPKRRSASC
jgi:hypothetical protein